MTAILDAPFRCPRDGKRMVMDTGQHEDRGDIEHVYTCWHCNYTERHHDWEKPRTSIGKTLAQRLRNIRLGDGPVELEIFYDDTPFPEMDLEALDAPA